MMERDAELSDADSTAIFENETGRLDFVHSPLNEPASEIRIATIYPSARADSLLRCRLSTFVLSEAPDYEALSYCWGDENNKQPICLQGWQAGSYYVTRNLHAALRQLRDPSREKRVWIDAICIDQNSHQEKNHQIPLMGEIYKRARQVIAWLGEADEETSIALNYILEWTTVVQHLYNYEAPAEYFKQRFSRLLDQGSWTAVYNLFERAYWTRLWALQECILATDLIFQCGAQRVTPNQLTDFLHADDRIKEPKLWKYITRDQYQLVSQRTQRTRPMVICSFVVLPLIKHLPSNFNYSNILQTTFNLKCKDPRDKLYAIIGLATLESSASQVPVVPDYDKDVPTIYTEFARSVILTTQTLELLPLAGLNNHGSEYRGKLPSWVTDLTHTGTDVCIYDCKPTGLSKTQGVCMNTPGELRTLGIICDTVLKSNHVAIEHDPGTVPRDAFQDWGDFTPRGPHPTGIPWRQVLFRNLLSDISSTDTELNFKDGTDRKSIALLAIGFVFTMGQAAAKKSTPTSMSQYDHNTYIDWFYLWAYGHEEFATATDQEKTDAFLHEFCGSSPSAVLDIHLAYTNAPCGFEALSEALEYSLTTIWPGMFSTQKGYSGQCRKGIQLGDQICILPGCPTPLIVRRVENRYLLIDFCYIYGIMQGEMMKEVRDGALKFEPMVFI